MDTKLVAAALSHDGAHALISDGDAVRLDDAHVLLRGRTVAAALLDGEAWVVVDDAGTHALHRFDLAGRLLGVQPLGALGAGVELAATRIGVHSALIEGERAVFVTDRGVEPLGERHRDRRILVGGRGVAERRGNTLTFRRGGTLALPSDLAAAVVVGGAMIFDGAAALVELESGGRRTAVVFDVRRGAVKSRVRLGEGAICAVAERKGLIVLRRGAHVALFDVRAGRCIGERVLPAPALACAIDADGTRLLVVDANGQTHALVASLADWNRPTDSEPESTVVPDTNPVAETSAEALPDTAAVSESESESESDADSGSGSESDAGSDADSESDAGSDSVSDSDSLESLYLSALGSPAGRVLPPKPLAACLADARAWIASLCATALATARDQGRGQAGAEIDAMLGDRRGCAADALAKAYARREEATHQFSQWFGAGAPHVEIARELGLSPLATSLLLLVAAPQIWGEIAGAYGLCVRDAARPLVDELLLAHLLDADTATRAAIGRELDEDAPLVASGAVAVARGLRPYVALSVHPAIARRLAGAPPARDRDDGETTAAPPRDLADIIGPRADIAALARRLAEPAAHPVRVVIRGRTSAGRRTIAAALAARAGREIGVVSIDAGTDLEARLTERLYDVALRGDLPCVALDALPDDPAIRARVRAVLDRHPGPLFLRAPRTGDLPIAPGYLALELAPLTETERRAAWEHMLDAHELERAPAAALAARFQVGPGAMARACAAAAAAAAAAPADLEPAIVHALRQHRSARIEAVAARVERLATWRDLIVADDIADALHELCARVRYRRTVLEDWGMRGVAATAQGVTALFQGAPGTGKTMAAEVVASALGYELWRVDLSKIVSKWLGETEKNLAAVFDAAEDGEIILLFDEADSLFGKRTEVKSSHDRNANLETNYLLQRLDTFTGVAILTTNFGTAIDPAFRRRLAVQAQFPLPDEADRERLWRAHLPGSLPVADELDLPDLARRYALTGGYIRNAVLRAAYVAAGRGTPVSHADLERAVRAEYLARGKVSATGAIA